MDYGLFTKFTRILVAHDFSPSSVKLKRGIRNKYSKFNIICPIKPKFFI